MPRIRQMIEKNNIKGIFVTNSKVFYVGQLIEKCDLALYGGYSDVSQLESTYQEAVELITKLNEVIG